ncbi:hypothetical protein [uncultured Rikenella sp.]|uniref:hypothetical protein n=1 Tax=uncultured Rikenella sp. TaxID=368003 RepID=UPI002601F523|nr:hypothetical protein [uncultured Rikenella sp.]
MNFRPAPGFRGAGSGIASYLGSDGYCVASAISESNCTYLRFTTTTIHPSRSGNRGSGLQLRCLSE